jgi:hypothetical protein
MVFGAEVVDTDERQAVSYRAASLVLEICTDERQAGRSGYCSDVALL